MNTLSFKDFEDAAITWDITRVPIEYKKRIVEINPPLTDEEIEEEHLKESRFKRHHYSYEGSDGPGDLLLPIDLELDNVINRRATRLVGRLLNTARKFHTLDTYDYFNEVEEKLKRKNEGKEGKTVWKIKESSSPSNDENLIQNAMELQRIRKERVRERKAMG